jgi:hypothetical protein
MPPHQHMTTSSIHKSARAAVNGRSLAERGALLIAALMCSSLPAFAQVTVTVTEQSDSTRATQCAGIATALTGVSADAASDSLEATLGRCEISGPAVFAAQWATVLAPGRGLADLVTASRYLRDERIFQAVQTVALDGTRANAVRIAAVNVLAAYWRPGLARIALRATTDGNSLVYTSEIDTISTAQPITGTIADRVYNTITEVAYGSMTNRRPSQPGRLSSRRPSAPRRDEVPVPENASAYASALLDQLNEVAENERFPIAPPHVTLSYVCGNKFSVKNFTTFDVALSYDVSSSGDLFEVRLPRSSGVGDYMERILTAPSAGIMRLFYLGDVIASAGNGATTCP